MKLRLHMCMPEGDGSRESYDGGLRLMKEDNQRVIAAMLRSGMQVLDTVGQLGLRYVPEQKRLDPDGKPLMDIYGLSDMLDRGGFSCGDAASYEAAVLEEKYGILNEPVSVPQGNYDFHAVIVTQQGVIDPTANFLAGRPAVSRQIKRNPKGGNSCEIVNGRVMCDQPATCCVDERGIWNCPKIPGLTGKKENIQRFFRSENGQMWGRTANGDVVPVCRRRR